MLPQRRTSCLWACKSRPDWIWRGFFSSEAKAESLRKIGIVNMTVRRWEESLARALQRALHSYRTSATVNWQLGIHRAMLTPNIFQPDKACRWDHWKESCHLKQRLAAGWQSRDDESWSPGCRLVSGLCHVLQAITPKSWEAWPWSICQALWYFKIIWSWGFWTWVSYAKFPPEDAPTRINDLAEIALFVPFKWITSIIARRIKALASANSVLPSGLGQQKFPGCRGVVKATRAILYDRAWRKKMISSGFWNQEEPWLLHPWNNTIMCLSSFGQLTNVSTPCKWSCSIGKGCPDPCKRVKAITPKDTTVFAPKKHIDSESKDIKEKQGTSASLQHPSDPSGILLASILVEGLLCTSSQVFKSDWMWQDRSFGSTRYFCHYATPQSVQATVTSRVDKD